MPSVTVKSDKGRQMSFRVQDPKNLEGYKVGDTVEITYTQALAVSVEPPGGSPSGAPTGPVVFAGKLTL